jgi:hypothetical protein
LGNLETKKGKIIYLDKENGIQIMKQRMPLIKRGLEMNENLDIGFICFSNLKIDKFGDLDKIEALIQEHKPTLLIVDTYRRGISFEENDANEVSKLFVDKLRPLVERNKLSIVLIHHDKKGQDVDEMDMIRGSSDLSNYADFILKNERKGKKIILKQLKMRSAPERNPLVVEVTSNDDSFIAFNSGGEYVMESQDKKCSQDITFWIMNHGIKEFTTKEAQEIAFSKGYKKNKFYEALDSLESNGIIRKNGRGKYSVTTKDLKLEV